MLNHKKVIQALIKLNQESIQTHALEFKKIEQHHTTTLNNKNHDNSLNEFNLILALTNSHNQNPKP